MYKFGSAGSNYIGLDISASLTVGHVTGWPGGTVETINGGWDFVSGSVYKDPETGEILGGAAGVSVSPIAPAFTRGRSMTKPGSAHEPDPVPYVDEF